MQNVSLKFIIITSTVVLVVLALAGGVYIWSNSNLKSTGTTNTGVTTGSSEKSSSKAANTAKIESTTTSTVTSDMLNANGDVDLLKATTK